MCSMCKIYTTSIRNPASLRRVYDVTHVAPVKSYEHFIGIYYNESDV